MKNIKKNQIIIYVIALMLVTAGYLNYSTLGEETSSNTDIASNNENVQNGNDQNKENVGDAALVNSQTEENQNTVKNVTSNENKEESKEETNTNTNANNNTATNTSTHTVAKEEEDDYFTNSKLERNTMFSEMLDTYQKILNSTTVSEEQKTIATNEITKINNSKNAIMICENLLSTKGFNKCVILVNGDSVNVVLPSSDVTQDKVAQIQNIVSREIGVEIENIHIMDK